MKFTSILTLLWLVVFFTPALGATVPKPRQKPADLVIATPEPKPTVSGSKYKFPKDNGAWSGGSVATAQNQCKEILAGLNMKWKPVNPIGESGGCGTAAPIEVSEIAGVALEPVGVFNCEMAAALHKWVTIDLKPAAQKTLGQNLTSIQNASSYVCRRRNGQAGGKLSEHAIANAFDISAFNFANGTKTTVAGQWSGLLQIIGLSKKGNFLRSGRSNACKIFTTVLGPGSDKYHGDHFHVDLAKRKSGYRICK